MNKSSWSPFLLAITLVSLAGCGTSTTGPQVIAEPPPDADSPIAAAQRLHWAFEHGDADVVAGLLTTNFVFGANVTGEDGIARRQNHDRATVLAALRAMLDGVAGVSTPASVSLEIVDPLVIIDDTRPGRTPTVHKFIFVPSTLRLEDSREGERAIYGGFWLLLARGDAAAIPPDQPAIPSHWWIEQIEEVTLVEVGLPGVEPRRMHWGDLLALYTERAARTSPVGDILTSR